MEIIFENTDSVESPFYLFIFNTLHTLCPAVRLVNQRANKKVRNNVAKKLAGLQIHHTHSANPFNFIIIRKYREILMGKQKVEMKIYV